MRLAVCAIALATTASAAAAGTVTGEKAAAVRTAVLAKLKDPDSAKFKGIVEYQEGHFCGWVNARNSLGGYTGFAVFFTGPKGTSLLPPELSEPSLCPPKPEDGA